MRKDKILLIDDEVDNLKLLKARLEKDDKFEVITTDDPRHGIHLAKSDSPDLILLDLNMPDLNGYEVCKILKSNYSTSSIPIVLLTCMDSIDHKLEGLEGGADDYIVKDKIEYREIAARIQSHLRRTRTSISASPLTKLPGNQAIEQQVQGLLEQKKSFVVGYLDIDNFKAYNDFYGFSQGDRIIVFVAQSLVQVISKIGNPNDFVGHIGGDDFIFITTPDKGEIIAKSIVKWIEKTAPQLYTQEDQERGFIQGKDRDGNPKKFDFIGVSVGLVESGPFYNTFQDFSETAAKIKKALKLKGGNSWGNKDVL